MAEKLIDNIELKISGSDWNEVKLAVYANGRRVEHTYHSVEKDTVMKLLNASSCPTLADWEGWLRDADVKKKKADGVDKAVCCGDGGNSWYSKR